jgi:RimJ/RimL family protein N-acetyltransferase
VESDGLTLRLYRLKDLPVLHSLFTPEIFLEASGAQLKASSSLSFYRWIKSTFQVVYVIEVEESGGCVIAGFVGLYNMKIGQSLWISLTIFSPEHRRRGYGTKALELLLDLLQKKGAAGKIYAKVSRTNVPSLCFLKKLGFEVSRRYEDSFVLEKRSRGESGEGLVNLYSNTIGIQT